MNNITLEKIRDELAAVLIGQKFGKIFTLSRLSIAIDFRLNDSRFLFISVEPAAPRIYLIERRLRDLEKQTGTPLSFFLFLRKRLAHAVLKNIEKIPGERVLIFDLAAQTELGEDAQYSFVVQLTGRSANLFLLDGNGFILDKLRETFGIGQEIAGRYAPPFRDQEKRSGEEEKRGKGKEESFSFEGFSTLSESLDRFYLEKEAEKLYQSRVRSAESKLKQELVKREKLVAKLKQDLFNHGDAEKWKRSGDLILANLADAARIDGKLLVVDYFDENVPVVELDIDENDSLTEAAEKFFRRYTKARNAKEEITRRLAEIETQIAVLQVQKTRLEQAIAERDEDFLNDVIGTEKEIAGFKSKNKKSDNFNGARLFVSSEGFEIFVGKASKDNDYLTFRIARAQDLWLHAADYPGSHVVIKNPNRREIPPKTLLEAAQIAAFYSHARQQPKVAVHYTPKKFVNKPKGAAPGLVSLSGFKTILVEPKIDVGE